MTVQTEAEGPKTCRHGGHPIDETRGYVEFVSTDAEGNETGPREYACDRHDKERRVDEFKKTRVLTTRLITEAVFAQSDRRRAMGVSEDEYRPTVKLWFDEFLDDLARVTAAAKVWEREVWFGGEEPHKDDKLTGPYGGLPSWYEERQYLPGVKPPAGSLQAFVDAAKWKGYRADVDGLTYLSYTMCARSIFQVDDDANETSVGIILDEDSPCPRGGIKSITATADQAVALIERAVADWKAGRVNLTHKDGVGFGF